MHFKTGSSSGGKVWGDEILFKILSPSLLFQSLPFSSPKRPPQTPQTLSQNQSRLATMLDIGTKRKSFPNIVERLQKKPLFQLIFLDEDGNESVEVKEVEEIDFAEVKMRVENGDSVFITRRENEKIDMDALEGTGSAKKMRKNPVI